MQRHGVAGRDSQPGRVAERYAVAERHGDRCFDELSERHGQRCGDALGDRDWHGFGREDAERVGDRVQRLHRFPERFADADVLCDSHALSGRHAEPDRHAERDGFAERLGLTQPDALILRDALALADTDADAQRRPVWHDVPH